MGNCCASPADPSEKGTNHKKQNKPNPYSIDYNRTPNPGIVKLAVLRDPTGHDIDGCFELGRELGRGEFGITYLCTDRATGEALACKSISKKKLRTAVDIEDVRREVDIMRHLPPHPNVVRLKGAYEDDGAVHLVMELCEGGELFDRIVARGHYTERAAAAITKTIIEVVQMCHKHGVIHRDLKPENFLFANNKENSLLKAIDFGLSVFFKPGERFSEIVGSPYYMAPEVLKRNYGPEVDVWSAGVILYILLCGVPPFWAETEQGIAQAIIRCVIDFNRDPWPKVSDNAKDLVRRMLDPDPTKRLTAQEVLDHPWLQNAKKAPNVSLGETVRARLKQFSVMNKFKKRALRVVAEQLSVEEVAGIKEMFEMMDINKNGKITLEELKLGLHKLGQHIPDPDVQILMDAVRMRSAIIILFQSLDCQSIVIKTHQLFVLCIFPEKRHKNSCISAVTHLQKRSLFISLLTVEKIFFLLILVDEYLITYRPDIECFGQSVQCTDKFEVFRKSETSRRELNADVDGNGTLDYGEFVAVSMHLKRIGNDEHLHEAFKYFDQNKSGYIEIEELRDSLADELGPNPEEVINAIIHDVDTDKDGRISYEEFAAMMKAGTDWRKASRQYSRERFNSLSLKLMKDGSLQLKDGVR